MDAHRVVAAQVEQSVERRRLGHVVLGMHLDEPQMRPGSRDLRHMRQAQADTHTSRFIVRRHPMLRETGSRFRHAIRYKYRYTREVKCTAGRAHPVSETVDRLLRRAGSIRLAVSTHRRFRAGPRRQGYKLGLRGALTALVLGTVVLTALLIHLFWSIAARRNVGDVVGQLNRQIVESIHHELHGVLDDASSMEEAVRSIFFQGTIKVTDEGKREFVFLALLRSQPSLSWISLGFPDGGFFGSRKASDSEIDMIEVKWDAATGTARQRTDYYTPEVGDIMFNNREFEASTYNATEQRWYRRAVAENGPVWNRASNFPGSHRQAIGISTPLIVDDRFVAVINVVIDLARLSQFLSTLEVGKSGTAVVLDRNGNVMASPDPGAIERQQNGETPTLRSLSQGDSLLSCSLSSVRTQFFVSAAAEGVG